MTADLVAWLTQIWDEEEAGWKMQINREATADGVTLLRFGRPLAEEMLARIAADRQILAHCIDVIEGEPVNAWYDGARPGDVAETTLRLLAQPYAEREGFRDEWRMS